MHGFASVCISSPRPEDLFSSKIFCKIDAVALSFVFDKYYLIMD